MYGLFRQLFVDCSFLGVRSSISLQFLFNILGICSPLFQHPPNLGYERMLVEGGFGILPLQLSLIIKGAESMFIIDDTDGFRYCSLCILDIIPAIGRFLEDCVRIFNVLGLPDVLFS